MRVNRVKMKEPAQTRLVDMAAAVRQDGLGRLAAKVSMKNSCKFWSNGKK